MYFIYTCTFMLFRMQHSAGSAIILHNFSNKMHAIDIYKKIHAWFL
jgi:hypothetical protein